MRIAVDAMGGDFAPQAIVEGSLLAIRECGDIDCLYLVGDESAIQAEIARCGGNPGRVEIRHASEVVGMGESPATAVRRKRDSSINRAMDLVKSREADAVFAAGSTGAAVASATLKLRTLEGIRRPGIAVAMPTPADKPVVLIDGGATTDCSPEILMQFAIMGSAYSHQVIGQAVPKVGLMSVGTEEAKGNALSKEAFDLIENSPVKFIGNVEGHDLFEGGIDIVLCDGFTGNIVLKSCEATAKIMFKWLKHEIKASPLRLLGALMSKAAFKAVKARGSYESYGGSPLLGVRGICIIGHGSSSAIAVKNAVRVATEAIGRQVNPHIEEALALAGTLAP